MSGYYPPSGPPPQQFGQPQQPPPGGQGYGQQPYGGHPGQYQQPPQQQWMPPPGPPPGHQQQQFPPMPPQQGYQQGYQQGPPPMQQNLQQPPPPQGFPQAMPPQGPPPQQQQQQYVPVPMPSPGYGSEVAPGNADADVQALDKAIGGFRKDHSTIIQILSKASPQQMALIRRTYAQKSKGASLESKVDSSFRNHYGAVLLQLAQGPLLSDARNVNFAIKGLGTKEDMLDDVLIGRSNADMKAIKAKYQEVFGKSMESEVENDLSGKTKVMYQLIMRATRTEETHPFNPAEIARDAEELHYATSTPAITTNSEVVYHLLTQRSDNQIRALTHEYQKKYRKTLEENLKANFSGHMQDALLLCVGRANDRAKTEAIGLENTMKGMGTKDDFLVQMTVRIHWDRQNMDQVKKAYQHVFKKDLLGRVRGETSGDYRDALIACLT